MILLFSAQSDECASHVYSCLREMGRDVLFVDDSLPTDALGINWRPGESRDDSYLEIEGRRVLLKDLDGIFLRFLNPLKPKAEQAAHDQNYVLYELSAALIGLLAEVECTVLNRPDPAHTGKRLYMRRQGSEFVKQAGLVPPTTFVGSTKASCLAFVRESEYSAFAVSGIGAGVDLSLGNLGQIEEEIETIYAETTLNPVFIQALGTGDLFDVFVVGEQSFPVPRGSWPLRDEMPAATDLSPAIAEAACHLVREMGLGFGQVSLQQDAAGVGHCYEVNEFPSFVGCPPEEQAKISQAIAEFLAASGGAAA